MFRLSPAGRTFSLMLGQHFRSLALAHTLIVNENINLNRSESLENDALNQTWPPIRLQKPLKIHLTITPHEREHDGGVDRPLPFFLRIFHGKID